jgi:hypothetical protein
VLSLWPAVTTTDQCVVTKTDWRGWSAAPEVVSGASARVDVLTSESVTPCEGKASRQSNGSRWWSRSRGTFGVRRAKAAGVTGRGCRRHLPSRGPGAPGAERGFELGRRIGPREAGARSNAGAGWNREGVSKLRLRRPCAWALKRAAVVGRAWFGGGWTGRGESKARSDGMAESAT